MSAGRVPGGQNAAGIPWALLRGLKLPEWLGRNWRGPGGLPQRHSGKTFAPRIETLEPRTLLAATPFISEFMASNANGIQDEFGETSDWIEITNTVASPINLQGYHLTDDS